MATSVLARKGEHVSVEDGVGDQALAMAFCLLGEEINALQR